MTEQSTRCQNQAIALPDFYSWLGTQPDALSLQAALYRAAADAQRCLADQLHG